MDVGEGVMNYYFVVVVVRIEGVVVFVVDIVFVEVVCCGSFGFDGVGGGDVVGGY